MNTKIFYFLFSFLIIQSIFLPSIIYSQTKDSVVNVIYLKDGTVIKGTIIVTEPGKTITIKTSDGFVRTYDFKKDVKNMDVEVYWIKSHTNDSLEHEIERNLEKNMPWRSSFYLAAGGGFPQIFRFDIGYNFGSFISLGLSFGSMDFWPDKCTSYSVIAKLHLAAASASIVPYFMLGLGSAKSNKLEPVFLEYEEATNSYKLFYFGVMISLTPFITASS